MTDPRFFAILAFALATSATLAALTFALALAAFALSHVVEVHGLPSFPFLGGLFGYLGLLGRVDIHVCWLAAFHEALLVGEAHDVVEELLVVALALAVPPLQLAPVRFWKQPTEQVDFDILRQDSSTCCRVVPQVPLQDVERGGNVTQ